MDQPSTSGSVGSDEHPWDPDFFNKTKATIVSELDKLKKIVNNINQMRVETAYLESDMMLMIDVTTWEEISQLIGPAPMNIDDITTKKKQ